ncbi:MAG: AMP-binding protein [Candidatus Eisenbacteria bacterium]
MSGGSRRTRGGEDAAMNPNLAARLSERAALHPDRPALVAGRGAGRRVVSFGKLDARVGRVAARLHARGITAGERVLIFVPMSIELYVALLAVLRLGAVAVFVDAWAGRRRLDAAVAAARPAAFLGTPRAHLLRLASRALRAIPRQLWVGRDFGAGGPGAPQAAVADVDAGAHALVTFTTGSTGRPKAAARSHAFLWAQRLVLARHLGLEETDVDMPTLPVFVLHDLATGCTCVLPDFDPRRPGAIDARAILAQMRDEGVTTCSASPSFFDALLAGDLGPAGALPVRALFTGGAPVLPALARRLAALAGTVAHVVYGGTEAEPIASIPAAELVAALDAPEPGLCAGRPVGEITLKLVRAHDGPLDLGARGWAEWEVAPGETGEIVVTGEHVLPGYLDDPASDRENKVREGARTWHRTGDAGRLDSSGRLWLMGRVKHRLERDGRVTWPLPVELAALRVAGVSHAAWIGVPGPGGRSRAVLCVETPGHAPDEAALRAAVDPSPVDEVVAFDRIPRDPRHASKTDTAALVRLLAGPR